MKLFNFIIIFLYGINTTSFVINQKININFIKTQFPRNTLLVYNQIYDPTGCFFGNLRFPFAENIYSPKDVLKKVSIINKTKGFLKIIRYKNIMPTLLLSFSGGVIINPSYNLFHSSKFIISSIITVLILMCSMITNDVFDVKIDRINNKLRPLVTGEITMREAKLYIFLLLSLTEFLNLTFLPYNLQVITHLAIINIILYTPIFKSILLIKNISCALLVGFAVVFAGLAAQDTLNIFLNKNIKTLFIASRLIFFGSLHNEILLDMTDVEGDSINNVDTIPVRFGLDMTWKFLYYITKVNVLWNTFDVIRLFNFHLGILFMLMSAPLIINLRYIKKYNYNKQLILHTVKETNKPLLLILLLLCFMSIPRIAIMSVPVLY